MTLRYGEFLLLTEKDNFRRLRECDFNVNEDNSLKNTKILGTLKKIHNPILILFYYNNTPEKILSEFFTASLEKNLEKGNEDDKILDSTENEEKDFKFGFVNLDLEKKIETTFQTMTGLNPFSWARIERDAYGNFIKNPFILFYYHSIPQVMYEGVVDALTIRKEFSGWRKELVEMENDEFQQMKKKIVAREGYYECLEDNLPEQGMQKGNHYYIIATPSGSGTFIYTFREV